MRQIFIALAFAIAARADSPAVVSVRNAGDQSANLCPGVLAAIYGTNFGSGPTSTVSVTVGGKQAYILLVSPSQINAQLPFDAPVGTPAPFVVSVNNVAAAPVNLTLDAFAPALFTLNGPGSGAGAILNSQSKPPTATSPALVGDTLTTYATGLGPTNPASSTGPVTTVAQTATLPAVTVGGLAAKVSFAGLAPGVAGLYQVNFTVPPGAQGTLPVVLSIGGKTTTPVTVPIFGISSVLNNASFKVPGTASPGSIVSVFANGIGTTDQLTGFPATTFQGVSVSFNGITAPLFHLAAAGQIDLLVPYELPSSGTVNVQLTAGSATSPNYSLTMNAANPGMYFLADPGTKGRLNILAQFNGTVWLAMPASMASALKLPGNCTNANFNVLSLCGQPAAPGDYLVLYTTGLGKATPNGDPNGTQLKTGAVPPADGSVLYKTVATPTITVGGVPAMVVFSGIAPGFPGLYQVDFQVPGGISGDDLAVVLAMPGGGTDTATVSVHSR